MRQTRNLYQPKVATKVFFAGERAFLLEARREHLNSRELLHRVYPIPYPNQVSRDDDDDDIEDDDDDIEDNYFSGLSREDRLLHEWFRAMCKKSAFWCQ